MSTTCQCGGKPQEIVTDSYAVVLQCPDCGRRSPLPPIDDQREQKGVANLPPLDPSKARDAVGKVFGVSGKTVDHGKSGWPGSWGTLVAR